MQTSSLALGGVISAVVPLIRVSTRIQKNQRLLALIALYLYVLETLFCRPELFPSSLSERYGARGPYGILKSNALIIMKDHESDRWFRQFFR